MPTDDGDEVAGGFPPSSPGRKPTTQAAFEKILSEASGASAALPWPETFPETIGIAVLGHHYGSYTTSGPPSLQVRQQEITGFEWHPDKPQYPNVARFKVKVTFQPRPPDEFGHFQETGYQTTNAFYVAVDRSAKTMTTIGFVPLKDESDPNGQDPFGFRHGDTASLGEWEYRTSTRSLHEFLFNGDNTVLREVNFGDPNVRDSGDWTKNCKFNIAKSSTGGALTPDGGRVGNLINPLPPALIYGRLAEIYGYLAADPLMFRSVVATDKRVIYTSVVIEAVTQVDTPHERFGTSGTITFEWQVDKLDAIEHVMVNEGWTPGWTMPELQVTNTASGDGAAELELAHSPVRLIKRDNMFAARQTVRFSGDMYEAFELEHYPFDVQPLTVQIEVARRMQDTCAFDFTVAPLGNKQLRDTEWSPMGCHAESKFTPGPVNHRSKMGTYSITVEVTAKRDYSVHLYRVLIVMAIFSLGSLLSLIGDPDVTPLDRLSVTVTFMLTATAYSLVVANNLPTLGYLTFLDEYILATFGFLALVAIQNAIVPWIAYTWGGDEEALAGSGDGDFALAEDDKISYAFNLESTLNWMAIIDGSLWLAAHLIMVCYVKFVTIPFEAAKAGKFQRTKGDDGDDATDQTTFAEFKD